MPSIRLIAAAIMVTSAGAFTPSAHRTLASRPTDRSETVRFGGFSEDYGWGQDVVRRKERNARFAENGDRVVEIVKPLGAVLEEDKNGDVFVASVSPGSNAAKSGLVPGERISMVSATFGNELWSVNGAGLGRVQKAIQVRVGNSVKLVVQNEQEKKKAAKAAAMSADEKAERFLAEQKKRDSLLTELNAESKEAAKGGFGLFKKNFGIWGNDEPQ